MATRSVSLLLLLMSSSISLLTLAAVKADDKAALLAFKAAVVEGGHGDALASWNSSSTSGYCSWEGVRCRGKNQRVVALSLPSLGFGGVLSPAVGNLSSLRFLNLSFNMFSGAIPASLGHLHHLQTLDLSYNKFSGELPTNLSSCISLVVMRLQSNQLRGRIPSELGNKLTRLEMLLLWKNNLTGAIPESLANLSSLQVMSLGFNQLEGTIPPAFGNIRGLKSFDLAFNNHLSGELPRSLYNLSSLESLQIQGNKLSGSIPADIGNSFPNMLILSLSFNKFTGSIPASLTNLTTLKRIELSVNRLSGHVPRAMGRLRDLQLLYLFENHLEADKREGWDFITSLSNCSQLQELNVAENDFTGELPSSIGNLSTSMEVLHLEYTGISGTIPSAIGNLVSLRMLGLGDTSISGMVPDSIGKLRNLGQLGLYNTNLSGLIPSSLGNLSKLTELFAQNANLEGAIPASLGMLKNLIALDLSTNRLNGSIPVEIFKLPLLSKYLDLSYNALSGPLPSEVGSLGNLNNMDLSGNQLSGELPERIGECIVLQRLWLNNNSLEGSIPQSLKNIKGLTTLNLSMNKFSGTIPEVIGTIHSLRQLNLAHNNLSGEIPTMLQNLTSLSELDLSFNNLQGEVPDEGIFRNLANLSITGNKELCGGMPQLHLAPCHKNPMKKDKRQKKSLTIALATTGALLSLALVIALIQLIYKKVRPRHNLSHVEMGDENFERVSYHALTNGTNGFSEANLLGKGTYGAIYRCTFQDQGTTVAVKVFNLEQSGSTRSFVAECETLRRVRHRCLIKIITCCSSIDHKGQEFKALVFEFMPNGSLNDWLHPKSDLPTLNNTLSLEQRLDVAVDIMDALDYLHNHCQPPIVHCDLKPSNILLAEDMSARVGDFGISRILPECASTTLQNSNSTVGIRGTIGYVAPEYGEGASVSTLGDVYSLGILLLEMFTGRSPTDDMFQGSLDLHKFSQNALPERIWEITDTTMWLHTAAYDTATRIGIENVLVSVITLGISCSKKQARERTPIKDAVLEMHAIKDSYLKLTTSLVVENGVPATLQ